MLDQAAILISRQALQLRECERRAGAAAKAASTAVYRRHQRFHLSDGRRARMGNVCAPAAAVEGIGRSAEYLQESLRGSWTRAQYRLYPAGLSGRRRGTDSQRSRAGLA